MSPPVFISYARSSSRARAEALRTLLGEERCFLDSADIETGKPFPERIADALLGAQVVVIFADATYFRRWYCLWELRTALGPYLSLGAQASEEARRDALSPIVVAVPAPDELPADLSRLPPLLRHAQWPSGRDTQGLAQLILERLARRPPTLGDRLDATGAGRDRTRARLLNESSLPPPANLTRVQRRFPLELPPSLGEAFIGRANELWQIDFVLSTLRGEITTAALTGALEGGGGFGKSRLALEYLHRLGPERFPGGIFWVDADVGEERLEEQFHGILRTLRPGTLSLLELHKQGRPVAAELAQALHEVGGKEAILYIVDNIPEAAPGTHPRPLSTWCPAVGVVALLATSRARLDLGANEVHALPVDTLAPQDAVALLLHRLPGTSPQDPAWREIAEWVGHLPLALVLLNRVLRARAVTREELLARSRQVGPVQELDRQQAAIQRHIPKGSLPGVTEVLRISYDRLLPAEQRAARFFAQLGHEPIPQVLLDALDEELASMDIRATLTARSFVTPVAAEVGSAVTMFGAMHRVLADFLRSQSPEPAREWGEAAAALLRVMTPEACQDPGAWQLMGACLPHAEALLDRPQATAGEPQVKLTVQLGLHTGVLLMSRGFYAQAYRLFTISLERGEPVLGKLHELTLSARSNIAFVLHKQGETHAAIEVTQALLDDLASTPPSEATQGLVLVEITALNSLAVFKRGSGELKEAREIQEELVTLSERLFGPMDPKTLTSMDNLAVTLTEQGDFEEARKLQERVLAAFAPQSHDALIAKANMAMALLKQRQAGRAAELLEQVVEEQQRILGENHPTTLSAMSNLGSAYAEQGEYAKAQKLYELVLGRCRQVLGEHHPRTLRALTSLFAVTMALEDFVRAEPLGQERLELLTRLQGVDAPDTQEAMDMLAKVRLMREDLPGARKLYEDLLVIHRRVHGEHSPETRKTHALLFGLAFKLQDFTRAAELLQENLVLQLREKGEDHPDTQDVLLKLAFTRHKQENYEEAHALQQRRVQSHVKTFGENDPRTLAVLADVATMLHSQGDNRGANEILEPLIEKSRQQLGDEHPGTLYVMELLAKTLEQGAPQRAAELLTKVTEARSRLPDPGTKGTPSS